MIDQNYTEQILAFEKQFDCYAARYEILGNGMIGLKIRHTKEVTAVMDHLTKALNLTPHQCYLAHLTALFHDIGRFEQVRRYNTFLDQLSEDHAKLGCEVLISEKFLDPLNETERNMVLTAITNHNRLSIEDELDPETELLSRLIRDADKCDIFRVFAQEDMIDTMGETIEQVSRETITPAVYDSILNHTCIDRQIRRTGLDKWIGFLGFFFDMNFAESIRTAHKKGYYKEPFEKTVFQDPKTAMQVKELLAEIEQYCSGQL